VSHCKVLGHSAVICKNSMVCLSVRLLVGWSVTVVSPAKMTEGVDMPFGLWAQMRLRNRVRWGPDPPWEG